MEPDVAKALFVRGGLAPDKADYAAKGASKAGWLAPAPHSARLRWGRQP